MSPRVTRLAWYLTLSICLVPWAYRDASEASEAVERLMRAHLSDRLRNFALGAKNSIHMATTDCTFGLVSQEIRRIAETKSPAIKVNIILQQDGHCPLPGFQPVPLPYELDNRPLEPLRVDEAKNVIYRREFIIVDEIRVIVILSALQEKIPNDFLIYQADLAQQPDAVSLMEKLKSALWPTSPIQPKGESDYEVRWSTTNHRRITNEVLTALKFRREAISGVEEGNVYVDRLSNQLNNPQHSMRNLGQTIAEARIKANEWVASRKKFAIEESNRGNFCCALFSIGQAIHTIQDRKHNWIFLYQHLFTEIISDFSHQYATEDWEKAHRETMDWCVTFLNELNQQAGLSATIGLKENAESSCRCGRE